MTKLPFVASCLFLSMGALAQTPAEDSKPKALITTFDDISFGFYGGLQSRYSTILDKSAGLGCAEGGVILSHSLSVGLLGCGVAGTTSTTKFTDSEKKDLVFGYGGFNIRYHIMPLEMVSYAVGFTAGAGSFADASKCDCDESKEATCCKREYDRFNVFEPEAAVYVQVLRWMRLGANVGYRFVGGVNTGSFKNRDFSAPYAGISVGFGKF